MGFRWPRAEIVLASSSSVSPETELMMKGLGGGGFINFVEFIIRNKRMNSTNDSGRGERKNSKNGKIFFWNKISY